MKLLTFLCCLWLILGARASVGPDYVRPTNSVPVQFQEVETGSWQMGRPSDAIPRGSWWRVFQDPGLDQLEDLASLQNQDLKAALARVEQARASTREARSEYFPSLTLDPAASRERYSPNGGLIYPSRAITDIKVPFNLAYEIDFWGRIRRTVEATTRDAEARAAAFESFRLLLHADVAQDYYSWRAAEGELADLKRTVELRQEARALIRARFEAGAANDLELARAETELALVEVEVADVARRCGQLKNSLALLCGAAAPDFVVSGTPLSATNLPPQIPPGLPGQLLERRPDVAEAERDLAARNARIGVAKAAFFPVVQITGMAGWESADVGLLFDWHSRIWSIGPSISLPIFQGGRNRAALRRARAVYDEGVANYRERVLIAFREVQDSLTGLHWLREQAVAQEQAVAASRRTAELSRTRYDAGFASYLEVVESERTRLSSERQAVQLAGQRFVVTIQLIKAIGGGWDYGGEVNR